MRIPMHLLTEEQRRQTSLFDSLFSQVTRFNSLFDARLFAYRGKLVVLQGDYPFYWVCRSAVAVRLEAMGYERVELS